MASSRTVFVFLCLVCIAVSQKTDKQRPIKVTEEIKETSNNEIQSNRTSTQVSSDQTSTQVSNTTIVQLQLLRELNGMMSIYAQFNFQDLPSDSLDPMPTLQKFFPHLANLLPIKQPGRRQKRAPATAAPGAGGGTFMGFLMQAMCAQQAAPNNNIFNPMMPNPMNPMNPMGPLFNMPWRGKRRAGSAARTAYSNRQLALNQRLLMSRMMARGRRLTTPRPMMGQLSAAESQAMMMNQMLPLLLMSQQANSAQQQPGVVGVDPSAPGAQAAPGGGGGGGGGGLDMSSLISQAMCMQAAMGSAPLHPPEPGTPGAAGAGGGMGMNMMSLFGR